MEFWTWQSVEGSFLGFLQTSVFLCFIKCQPLTVFEYPVETLITKCPPWNSTLLTANAIWNQSCLHFFLSLIVACIFFRVDVLCFSDDHIALFSGRIFMNVFNAKITHLKSHGQGGWESQGWFAIEFVSQEVQMPCGWLLNQDQMANSIWWFLVILQLSKCSEVGWKVEIFLPQWSSGIGSCLPWFPSQKATSEAGLVEEAVRRAWRGKVVPSGQCSV